METRLDFWHRQTLREKPAEILADWKADAEEQEKLVERLRQDRGLLFEVNGTMVPSGNAR